MMPAQGKPLSTIYRNISGSVATFFIFRAYFRNNVRMIEKLLNIFTLLH